MHNCRTIEFEKHSEQDMIETFKKCVQSTLENKHLHFRLKKTVSTLLQVWFLFTDQKKEVWSLCIFSKYEKRGSSWAFMGPKSFTHMTNGVEQRFVSPVISTNLERSFFPASVIENEL